MAKTFIEPIRDVVLEKIQKVYNITSEEHINKNIAIGFFLFNDGINHVNFVCAHFNSGENNLCCWEIQVPYSNIDKSWEKTIPNLVGNGLPGDKWRVGLGRQGRNNFTGISHINEWNIEVESKDPPAFADKIFSVFEEIYPDVNASISKIIADLPSPQIIPHTPVAEEKMPDTKIKHPLNQILYGPPGTGKTFETRALTVAIANNQALDKWRETDRKLIKEAYEKLVSEGRIVFTTFHQSMSYEDFVEGIKAETSDTGQVNYKVKDGILKMLCNYSKPERQFNNWFNSLVSRNGKNLMDFIGNDVYRVRIDGVLSDEIRLIGRAEKGGEITGHIQKLLIKSIFIQENTINKEPEIFKKELSKIYIYGTDASLISALYADFYSFYWTNTQQMGKPHILIIDEINRGNISSIFGELITLIEEDKRIGNKEELKLILPYSKEPFGLPNNLYIIGTMNTADRSVEALDTALRRRFSFTEMLPKPELLRDNLEGINLQKLLETINLRLTALKDSDHTIGHAFLINANTFEDVKIAFADKILPLFQEFFYGELEKVGLVLGDAFLVRNVGKPQFMNTGFYNKKLPDTYKVALLGKTEVMKMDVSDFKAIYA